MINETKLKYIQAMLKIIKKNLEYLIEVAEDNNYEDTFIEWLKETKEDVVNLKEVFE